MTGLMLMENAGRGCADLLCELGIGGPVAICCGKGNNGGDGFVIARHLEAKGYDVRVLLFCDPATLSGDAEVNYTTLVAAESSISVCPEADVSVWLDEQLRDASWVVDALLGTGATGDPRPPLDAVISQLNAHAAKRLAIDLPSGMDCDSGCCASTTFQADHTATFVAEKRGFDPDEAQRFLGQVHVLDIGVPKRLLEQVFTVSN